jgi:hypothetical protein
MTADRQLIELADGLWVAQAPLRFLGTHLGARMTVVRLSNGELWVHSPVAMNEALLQELKTLGQVRHIVAPNLFHHLFVSETATAFPDATLYAAPGLSDKRADIHFHETLGATVPAAWRGDLEFMRVDGTSLGEMVFFHAASRTLISSDLVQNFGTPTHLWTRVYVGLQGLENRCGHSLIVKMTYRDKAAARGCIDALLDWDFDRVVLAHGNVISTGGKEKVREAFDWLAG